MPFLNKTQKNTLNDFTKFVKDELGIKKMPKIQILNGRGDLKTTANYDYTKDIKIIKINGKKRATIDIMRSLAHELTHHKQHEEDRIKDAKKDGADGSEIENEANAKAGYFIRVYCKKNPKIYDLDEQEETTPSAEPSISTAGTTSAPSSTPTSTSSKPEGYPEVGHWESGVTRGPANQIGNTKWADIVGSALKRGKANQLK
jgi:hypothetical protein